MTPCTGPSLSSAAARTQATTCGCASVSAEQPELAYESSFERAGLPAHGMTLHPGPSFDPVPHGRVTLEGPVFLLLVPWMIFALRNLAWRRRPHILTLRLAAAVADEPPPVTIRPRLVFPDGERRVLREVAAAFGRRRSVVPPRLAPAYAASYSQPRLRNQTSMPPPMAMHTPQKIG